LKPRHQTTRLFAILLRVLSLVRSPVTRHPRRLSPERTFSFISFYAKLDQILHEDNSNTFFFPS
jgi:hypothetical protein